MHPLLQKQYDEITTNKKDTIVITGMGGHAGVSWRLALNRNTNINIVLLINAFDSGGDTGKLVELLGTLALGDFRKTLTHLLRASNGQTLQDLAVVLDKRVNNFEDLAIYCKEAIGIINKFCDTDLFKGLNIDSYIKNYIERYNTLDIEFTHDSEGNFIDHNVGNLIFSALLQLLGGFNEIVYRLKEAGIIPHHLYFVSMADENIELVGEDETGEIIIGENRIDSHSKRFCLKKLWCIKKKGELSDVFSDKNEFITKVIRSASAIIAPASTPYNWSIINSIYKDDIEYALNRSENPAIGICMSPITQEKNTFGIADIVLFLWRLFPGKFHFIISESPEKLIKEHFFEFGRIIRAYIKEGKELQLFDPIHFASVFYEVLAALYPELFFNQKNTEILLESLHPVSGAVSIGYDHPEIEEFDVPLTSEQSYIHASFLDALRGIKHNADFINHFIYSLSMKNWEISNELFREIQDLVDDSFRMLMSRENDKNRISEEIQGDMPDPPVESKIPFN